MISLVLIATLFTLFTLLAAASSVSFTVYGGGETTRILKLSVEDHVLISFTIVGSSESTIHFYLVCPNGTVRDFGDVGYFHSTFVCDLDGDYVLRFSNVDSSVDKLVTLNCEVEHYVFGIPQMLFLTIVIAVVCVIAVASFVFLSKTY